MRVSDEPRFPVSFCQGLFQIGNEIVNVFDADRQAQQVFGYRAAFSLDRVTVLDQALDATQRRCAHEHPAAFRNP